MGVDGYYSDTRTAQGNNGSITVTIPPDVSDELDVEAGDSILIRMSEGADRATIENPDHVEARAPVPHHVRSDD